MDFGEAIKVLKSDGRVRRAGWNGKGMWLELWRTDEGGLHEFALDARSGRERLVKPCVAIATPAGGYQPGWTCSQEDMLAEDWEAVV